MKNKTKRIDLVASASDEMNLQRAAAKLGSNKISQTIFNSVAQAAERVEYFCNRPALKLTDENVYFGLIHLQKFCDKWKTVTGQNCDLDILQTCFAGIGTLGSRATIQNAIAETVKTKLYDAMVAKHPDMVVSFENVPAKDLSGLFEIADTLNKIPVPQIQFNACIFWPCYSVNGNIISVIPSELEKLKDAYRFYAEGPDQLRRLELVNGLCNAINKILADPSAKDYPAQILSTIYYDSELAKYVPSGAYVKFSLAPQSYFIPK